MKKIIIFTAAVILLAGGAYLVSFLINDSGEAQNQLPDVKIGFIGPLSGDVAVYGASMKQALELARKELAPNLEIIYEDTSCDVDKVIPAMNRLLANEDLVAIVGEACSGATLAAAPMAEHSQVVLISPASTSPEISWAGKYIFRTAASDTFMTECASKLLKTDGGTNIAILHGNEPYGIGYADAIVKAHEQHEDELEHKLDLILPFERSSLDFSEQVQKMKDHNIDTVLLVSNSVDAAVEAIKQIRTALPDIKLFASEGIQDQSLVDASEGQAEGLTITSFTFGSEDFKQRYQAMHGVEPGLFAAHSYDALATIIHGLSKGATDGPTLKNSLNNIDFPGESGRIMFDTNGDVSSTCYKAQVKENILGNPVQF